VFMKTNAALRATLLAATTVLGALGCASTSSSKPPMGVISDLSRVEGPAPFCEHKVPEQVCTLHHPELIPKFKAVNDWCPEHGVPESQCFQCHPDLTFEAFPQLKSGADVATVSKAGEDLADLKAAAAAGKVTVFDFYADWCAGCREIDLHMYKLLNARDDVALRKVNVVDWDTPVAKRHLQGVAGLPYVVVYSRSGAEVARIQGVKLEELDKAIAEAAKQ
jgi:thiol-disulfide isomerase/thioredoxin